jgi:CRISPR-associated protein Csb2
LAGNDGRAIQFAIGGLMLPPVDEWITITERIRGRAVRALCRTLAADPEAHYGRLTAEQRHAIALISGKDAVGKPLKGHQHAYFFLCPDEHGEPTRLVVWRPAASFNVEELRALRCAVERPVAWLRGELYLVPLPVDTPLPELVRGPARFWCGAAPFVPPSNRHRFRNGELRQGEAPERAAGRLLSSLAFPAADVISASPVKPVRLHRTRQHRILYGRDAHRIRPAYNLFIQFPECVQGPILIGDSCHFGLGLFRAVRTQPYE